MLRVFVFWNEILNVFGSLRDYQGLGNDALLLSLIPVLSHFQCILILSSWTLGSAHYPELVSVLSPTSCQSVQAYCMCVITAPMPWHQTWALKRWRVQLSSSSLMESSSQEWQLECRRTLGSSEVLHTSYNRELDAGSYHIAWHCGIVLVSNIRLQLIAFFFFLLIHLF